MKVTLRFKTETLEKGIIKVKEFETKKEAVAFFKKYEIERKIISAYLVRFTGWRYALVEILKKDKTKGEI